MKCQECNSTNLTYSTDSIFGTLHEWADCDDCICLYVKNIDTEEWIETSSLTSQRDIGKSTGMQALQKYTGGAL